MTKSIVLLIAILMLGACQSPTTPPTLYDQLGGEQGIATIVDNLIDEISFDPVVYRHFANTDTKRFRTKWNEYLCEVSDGPCQYTGDSMLDSHRKLNITEGEFNRVVDLLINALNRAGVPHTSQNRLLARLKDTRDDIIYR